MKACEDFVGTFFNCLLEEMDIDSSEDDTGPVEDDEMKEEGKLKGKMSAKKGRKSI